MKTIPDRVYDPTKQNLTIDRNLYFAGPNQSLVLYGVPWRARHQAFADLAAFTTLTGFDALSRVADPLFVNATGGDFRFQPNSPARAIHAGWGEVPRTIAQSTNGEGR